MITLLTICTWVAADFFIGRPFSTSFIIYWNIVVRLSFFVITTNLISDLRARLDLEERLARTDPLTQLCNRRCFLEIAEMEIARAKRSKSPFTVVYMDLDNFKEVNDWHGHHTGDQVLQMVAYTMKKNTRQTDTVARLGGDEFAILLLDAGEEAANGFVQKLQTVLLKCMQDKHWPVTFSMGVITFLQPPKSVNVMLKEVDDLLYLVKQAGKNTFLHEILSRIEKDG